MAETKDKVITAESLKAKHDYDEETYLKQSGGTMSGTLILTNANDAEPTAYNSPALVVGGAETAAHLEMDANEILAKGSENTAGNLFLNSNVGDNIKVSISGSVNVYNTSIVPCLDTDNATPKNINIGATDNPFNQVYGKYYNLYNKYDNTNTDYGALRVGKSNNDESPMAVLELGNNADHPDNTTDTVPVSSRITMYNGKTFTNLFANSDTERNSNAVTLPQSTGTMLVYKASTTDIGAGSNLAADTLYLVYE